MTTITEQDVDEHDNPLPSPPLMRVPEVHWFNGGHLVTDTDRTPSADEDTR